MPKKLDFLDLKILEGLGVHGPRNITDVARKLGVPAETLRKRLRRLRSHIFLRFHVNIYHTNLGLKKAVVIAEAFPGCEELLFNCLKSNEYWIYLSRCYGINEGCVGVYVIPKGYESEFQEFLFEVEKLGIARNVEIYWSTCFQSVHSKCTWFDRKSEKWIFPWEQWIEEIQREKTKLPYTLIDPKEFPLKADEMDIFILKELEKNPTVNLIDLANMLNVSQQLVGYHYRNHIIQRGLIESFNVLVFHFDPKTSDMFLFILEFDTLEKLAKFASSLLDKPFVGGLGKVLNRNALIAHLYLPRLEFRKFIDILSNLIDTKMLQSYRYIIQDLRKVSRETIPYQCFKDGKWIYDHKRHIESLRNLVRNAKTTESNDIG